MERFRKRCDSLVGAGKIPLRVWETLHQSNHFGDSIFSVFGAIPTPAKSLHRALKKRRGVYSCEVGKARFLCACGCVLGHCGSSGSDLAPLTRRWCEEHWIKVQIGRRSLAKLRNDYFAKSLDKSNHRRAACAFARKVWRL